MDDNNDEWHLFNDAYDNKIKKKDSKYIYILTGIYYEEKEDLLSALIKISNGNINLFNDVFLDENSKSTQEFKKICESDNPEISGFTVFTTDWDKEDILYEYPDMNTDVIKFIKVIPFSEVNLDDCLGPDYEDEDDYYNYDYRS